MSWKENKIEEEDKINRFFKITIDVYRFSSTISIWLFQGNGVGLAEVESKVGKGDVQG